MKLKYSIQKYISVFLIAILVFSSFPHVNYASEVETNDEEATVETIDENIDKDEQSSEMDEEEQVTVDEEGEGTEEDSGNVKKEVSTPEAEEPETSEKIIAPSKEMTTFSVEGEDEGSEGFPNLSIGEINERVKADLIDLKTAIKEKDLLSKYGRESFVWAYGKAGGEVPQAYYDDIVSQLEKEDNFTKTTNEISKVIIALSAADFDATDINGTDLVQTLLDKDIVNQESIATQAYALNALDSGDYDVNEETKVAIVASIIDKQMTSGGWGFFENIPSPDATGMVLNALAPYKKADNVKKATDKAVAYLADGFDGTGWYYDQWSGGYTSAAISQVIIGLTAFGINPTESPFVDEKGKSLLAYLLEFKADDGLYKNVANGNSDMSFATPQSFLALAYYGEYAQLINKDNNAGEDPEIPVIDKTELETLIAEAEKIDLSNMTDNSKEELVAVLNDARTILNNDKATQQEVDDAKLALKKAIENLKERAPPIKVNVRIEAHDKTLVPTTELEIEPFDIQDYITQGTSAVPSDKPRAIHAIIRALETVDGFNAKDNKDFKLGFGGNYIQQIGEYGEFTHGPMTGWMYYVNNGYADKGVGEFDIKDGDSIVVYYVQNIMDSTYTWFDEENYTVEVDEELSLTLHGDGLESSSTEGAHLLVDDIVYQVEGEPVLADENGDITVSFDEPGTYHLSANRVNSDGERNIVRPYAIVEVVEGEEETPIEPPVEKDEEPPVITISGIEDGQTITEDSITFTVVAEDDVDGKVLPTVTANGKGLTRKNDNEYTAKLDEGSNDFVITAVDKAGNKTEKKLTVTYEPIIVDKDVQGAIQNLVEYVLNTGVTGEWEAVGLAKAGVTVPESYQTYFYETFENEIVNGLESGRFTITDAERLTLAALAINQDPRNINGINLIELIYNSPDRPMWDGSVEDTMTFQGNNGLAFALIALDAANFDIPKNARWTRETLVAKLVETQRDDGAWNLNDLYPAANVDVTAMVMTALAPYKDDKKVQTAIDKAVDFLTKTQINDGGFDGGSFVGGVTSEVTSQVIIALTANGIDPTGELFTKSQNLIEHLLSFQHKNGGFTHTLGDKESNNMATEQALQALVAYDLFLQKKGSLYQFELNEDDDSNDNKPGTGDGNEDESNNGSGSNEETPENIDIDHIDNAKDISVSSGQKITINGSKLALVLPENLPKGTTVTITVPNKSEAPSKKDNLKLAGDWYDFSFDYAGGKLPDGATFTLTLAVDKNISLDDAGIYHLDEKTGKWELVADQIKNEADHTITVEVTHFSIYAVLAKVEEDETEEKQQSSESDKIDDTNVTVEDETEGKQKSTELDKNNDTTVTVEGKTDDTTKESADKLPSTATNSYNVLFVGLILFALGLAITIYRRRNLN